MYNRSISGKIKYISDRIRQKGDNNLKDHGITLSQVRVLRFLNGNGGSCSQKEIEDYLQVSHPTVAGLVSRMEQAGFLQTSVSATDKRNKVVSVTEKGRSLSADLCKYMVDIEQKMFVGLTDEQLQQLSDALNIIAANLG